MSQPDRQPHSSPTPESAEQPSIGELVSKASEQLSALVRAEIELARGELAASAKRVGLGAGLFGAAAVVLLLSLPFAFVTLAEVLIRVALPRWAAYLVVWALFLIIATVLGLLGWRQVRRVPKPERTMQTVRDTARWARRPTSTGSGPDGMRDPTAIGPAEGSGPDGTQPQTAAGSTRDATV